MFRRQPTFPSRLIEFSSLPARRNDIDGFLVRENDEDPREITRGWTPRIRETKLGKKESLLRTTRGGSDELVGRNFTMKEASFGGNSVMIIGLLVGGKDV